MTGKRFTIDPEVESQWHDVATALQLSVPAEDVLSGHELLAELGGLSLFAGIPAETDAARGEAVSEIVRTAVAKSFVTIEMMVPLSIQDRTWPREAILFWHLFLKLGNRHQVLTAVRDSDDYVLDAMYDYKTIGQRMWIRSDERTAGAWRGGIELILQHVLDEIIKCSSPPQIRVPSTSSEATTTLEAPPNFPTLVHYYRFESSDGRSFDSRVRFKPSRLKYSFRASAAQVLLLLAERQGSNEYIRPDEELSLFINKRLGRAGRKARAFSTTYLTEKHLDRLILLAVDAGLVKEKKGRIKFTRRGKSVLDEWRVTLPPIEDPKEEGGR